MRLNFIQSVSLSKMSRVNLRENATQEQRELVDELFRRAVKKFPRRSVEIRSINDLFQSDLCDMNIYMDENRNYRYILLVINCFTKFCYAKGLRTKTAAEVCKAMTSILDEISGRNEHIKLLHTDAGSEYINKNFQSLMKKHNIHHYITYSHLKAQMAKRLIRTLRRKFSQLFMLRGSTNWIDILQDVIDEYNNTVHSKTKMRPIDICKENEKMVYDRAYRRYRHRINRKPHKFKIGQYVRVSKYKRTFEKDHTNTYSIEPFQIHKIRYTSPTTYTLRDLNGDIIKGAFYEQELQATKHHDVYLIERVIKQNKDKTKTLVKWFGYNEPEWIETTDIF